MAGLFDHVIPGPAGLFFSCEELNEAGWLVENEARSRLERWCAFCGQASCYGFGDFRHRPGKLTCSDPDCMRQGETWAAENALDRLGDVKPDEAVPAPPAAGQSDLFGEAA